MVADALFSSAATDWCTPPRVIERVHRMNRWSTIDLDPCSNPRSIVPATVRLMLENGENGLDYEWKGKTYVNPPYGRKIAPWIDKAIDSEGPAEIVMLVPARTDTKWFQRLLGHCNMSVCFVAGRLTFNGATNPAPFPSAVVYLGWDHFEFRKSFQWMGEVMTNGGA